MTQIINGFHLTGEKQRSVLVQAGSGTLALYQNKTAVPDAGNFESSTLHTFAGTNTARFAPAPQGNVIICNGDESLIWGGEEHRCAGLISYDPDGTFSYDYSEQIDNTKEDDENVAVLHTVSGGVDTNTVMLLHFDDDVADACGNHLPVNVGNKVTYENGTAGFNKRAVFDGASAYITVPTHNDFDFRDGTWSIGFRARVINSHNFSHSPVFFHKTNIYKLAFTSGGGAYTPLVGDEIEGETSNAKATIRAFGNEGGDWTAGTRTGDFYLDQFSGTFGTETLKVGTNLNVANIASNADVDKWNCIYIYLHQYVVGLRVVEGYSSFTDIVTLTTNNDLTDGTEHHIVISENGNDWYIFVDGVRCAHTNNLSRTEKYIEDVVIGYADYQVPHDYFLPGSIDEYRVSNIARYTSDFNSPTEPYSNNSTVAHYYVGSTRPLEAIKPYIKNANTEACDDASVYYWDGSSLVHCDSIVDGTKSGGISHAQTGIISFDSTDGLAKTKWIKGLILYWYKVYINKVSAGIKISHVTVNAPVQSIKNIWGGDYSTVVKCKKWNGTLFTDYTVHINDYNTGTYAELGGLQSTHYLLIAFTEPQQAGRFYFVEGESNTTAAELTYHYSDGEDFTAIPKYNDWDKTAEAGVSFNKTGAVTFTGLDKGTEFMQTIDGDGPFYWYKLSFDATLSASVNLFYIAGIRNPPKISSHEFAISYQNRALLCSPNGEESAIEISYENQPDTYNGWDSTILHIGSRNKMTAGIGVFNRFGASIYDFCILCKQSETWLLNGYAVSGDGQFRNYQISSTKGCPAPRTMVGCEVGYAIEEEVLRNVVVWLTYAGPYIFDGGIMKPIKGIECYFKPNDSRCINYEKIDKSFCFFDALSIECNLLFCSGTSNEINTWLIYDLLRDRWTKKVPTIYPTCAFTVTDTDGAQYTYLGSSAGYMYRNEHTNAFDGTAIAQEVTFSDILPNDNIFENIRLDFLKTIVKTKNVGTSDNISVYHRANGDESWGSLTNVPMFAANKRAVKHIQRINKIGVGHELRLAVSPNDKDDGFEPIGLGILYHTERINVVTGVE